MLMISVINVGIDISVIFCQIALEEVLLNQDMSIFDRILILT